jgi:hypothetical protein
VLLLLLLLLLFAVVVYFQLMPHACSTHASVTNVRLAGGPYSSRR